jgi:hypothetical protein
MDRQELYELWQRNKDRPAFVREYADEIEQHTDTADPVPDGTLFDVRQWLDSYKGTVTRQLNDSEEGTDPTDDADDGESDTTADTEQGE